ncbi:TPA: LSM domain protein [Staphylococcus aureus]|nr:LSM domain protein [Staphylococcus aureus]
MNLQSYIGKLVKLTLTNNKILIGKVIDFDDKVDNFDGYNSIEIDTGRFPKLNFKHKVYLK